MPISETTDYDPRYERAQTIEGAEARWLDQDGYTEVDLERDIERLIETSEYPDRDRPDLTGQRMFRG